MNNLYKICYLLTVILFFQSVAVAHELPEKYYQNKWCSAWHGTQEYTLRSKTRIDCVTKNYAVEFDFANKWAEAIGQSLYYAECTCKKPAIILIIENKKDWKYYNRIKYICKQLNIKLWYMLSPTYNSEQK